MSLEILHKLRKGQDQNDKAHGFMVQGKAQDDKKQNPHTLRKRQDREKRLKKGQTKKPSVKTEGLMESGNNLSSRSVARRVLSAQLSLTSVFGMRTGGTSALSSPQWIYKP